MNTRNEMIDRLETLCTTSNPADFDLAAKLFGEVMDLYGYAYFNPGEPVAECVFCGASRPLPGVYGDDAYTSEELEDPEFLLDDDAYWARVWAIRALDILDPQHVAEPCCAKRAALREKLEG